MNKSHIYVFIFIFIFSISGCANKRPQLTREEWIKVSTRTYTDKTKDEVFSATEKLLRLADGDDFIITYTEDELYAERKWSFYLVIAAGFGTDYWLIKVKENDTGVLISIRINTQSQNITPMATTSGAWTATTSPLAGSPVLGTALYELFFSRLDYLLGKRDDWMSCEALKQKIKEGLTWGNREPLCNSLNINDNVPEGVGPPPNKYNYSDLTE